MTDWSKTNMVVDTSIHFAAWRSPNKSSPCREVVVRAARKHYKMAVSPLLLAEIYEKMTENMNIAPDKASRYIKLVATMGVMYRDVENDVVWCSDPDDAYVFVLYVTSKSRGIVSYDKIFSDTNRFIGPTANCIKPIDFLKELRLSRGEQFSSRAVFDGELDELAHRTDEPQPPDVS